MAEKTQSNAPLIALGVVAAVVVGAGVLMFAPDPGPQPQATAAPDAAPAQEPVVAAAPDLATQSTPDALIADTSPALDLPPTPGVPVFDTFRVEPDGAMVVAGRADPGQTVEIMLGGQSLDRVTADASGSFVALPLAGPSDLPRTLFLVADPDGAAVRSDTSFIVAAIAATPVIVADAPQLATDEPAADPLPDTGGGLQPVVADVVSNTAPALPTVLQADTDGIRVVQTAPAAISAPVVVENVALDAITYDPQGVVQLSGRAVGDGAVQVYLNNEPIVGSDVTEGGDWRIGLPNVDTGIYTLRIDELNEAGDVVSRIETPFKREQAEDVAAVLAEETARDGFDVAVKTVQPGATLWAIAEENLGDGIFYVEVFEANADLIKDPDLIYPGQIFRIPEIVQ